MVQVSVLEDSVSREENGPTCSSAPSIAPFLHLTLNSLVLRAGQLPLSQNIFP